MEIVINILAVIGLISIIITLFYLILKLRIIQYYSIAILSNIDISFSDLIFMSLRKVDFKQIIDSLVILEKQSIQVNKMELEAFYLAEGNLQNLVNGLVYAKNENIVISYSDASKMALKNSDLSNALKLWKISHPNETQFSI